MLGFCCVALLGWQLAADGHRRALALAGICFEIEGAVACHYYAVMIFLPLAGGKASRSFQVDKIYEAIWAALILGATPLVVALRGLEQVGKIAHPIAQATRQDFLQYYLSVYGT